MTDLKTPRMNILERFMRAWTVTLFYVNSIRVETGKESKNPSDHESFSLFDLKTAIVSLDRFRVAVNQAESDP